MLVFLFCSFISMPAFQIIVYSVVGKLCSYVLYIMLYYELYFVNSVFFECNANESFMWTGPQED